MRSRLWVCGVMVAMLSSVALGQEVRNSVVYGPEQGDWEATLGGGGANDNDFNAGGFNINGSIGYFITDDLELALRQSINYANVSGNDGWNGSTRVAIDYHFDLGRFRPFVGANIGAVYGNVVEETGAAGLEAGLKYYVLPKTFLMGMMEYQWFFDNSSSAGNNFDDGQFVYTIGIGFNF